jgi:hypothetical protein
LKNKNELKVISGLLSKLIWPILDQLDNCGRFLDLSFFLQRPQVAVVSWTFNYENEIKLRIPQK